METAATWAAQYQAGDTIPTIAARHGVAKGVVRRHLERVPGLELRDDRRRGVAPETIARLYRQGLTAREIAAELGIGYATVLRRLADVGREPS